MLNHVLLLLCFLGFTAVSRPAVSAQTYFRPTNPYIRYTGRVDTRNALCTRFDWSYITIETVFEGTSCAVGLNAKHDIYNVFIDGEFSHRFATDSLNRRYTLASGLPDTLHHLLLTKRYETDRYITECTGIYLDSGRTLHPPPPRPKYRIEFIGASTLLGYGNESSKPKCDSVHNHSNTYYSYGPVAARLVGAECSILAITRRGLVRNYHSPFITSFRPFQYYYHTTLWNDTTGPKWNYRSWVPDVVVITLGTNDFSTRPYPPEALFANRLFAFTRELYRLYPGVHIVLLSPPVDPLCSRMSDFAEREQREGNRKISFLAYDRFPDWYRGCDWHPNVKAHRKIAEELAAHIRPQLKHGP
ncbi:MAG: hypothetical protein JW863_17355 [Chitinispirillaceae bacterium]|nr:hypothetical protein [Chitinispirillaceae bacterium]